MPEITELLRGWSRGDKDAADKLLPLVYRELKKIAAAHMRRERGNHTLVATALVHEAFLRLAGQDADFENRGQFFGVAASMMRRVLVDHARARHAAKRPRAELAINVDDANLAAPTGAPIDLLGLDAALDELAKFDERQARLVELRYFAGLTSEQVAEVLGVSLSTVKREWNLARAWLYRRLQG
jgi:RNA polymerase sigma factor (TIGR02999 family)